ncbi:MAG: pyridine nucleotide-disulfide oxidoreductase, partial [Phycisphaerales bacterium]|nr:pyridine nucleotide-disulfide oxidoreductase [Phycisphaerales bacterium]
LDHWDNAAVTGALAGRNMAGVAEPYAAVNTFFSDVFDLTMNGWGEARQVHHRLLRVPLNPAGNGAVPDLVEIGIAPDGRVAQVLALGHTGEDDLLRELVARRVNVNGREEKLKDPATPLGEFMD